MALLTFLKKGVVFVFDLLADFISIGVAAFLIYRYQTQSVSDQELLVGILSILTILSVTSIWDRYRKLRRMSKEIDKLTVLIDEKVINPIRAQEFFSLEKIVNDAFFESTTELRILGITLGNTINEFSYKIGELLKSGAKIQIIVVKILLQKGHKGFTN